MACLLEPVSSQATGLCLAYSSRHEFPPLEPTLIQSESRWLRLEQSCHDYPTWSTLPSILVAQPLGPISKQDCQWRFSSCSLQIACASVTKANHHGGSFQLHFYLFCRQSMQFLPVSETDTNHLKSLIHLELSFGQDGKYGSICILQAAILFD